MLEFLSMLQAVTKNKVNFIPHHNPDLVFFNERDTESASKFCSSRACSTITCSKGTAKSRRGSISAAIPCSRFMTSWLPRASSVPGIINCLLVCEKLEIHLRCKARSPRSTRAKSVPAAADA